MGSIYQKGMDMMDNYSEFLEFVDKYPRVFEPVTYPDGSTLYECEGQKLHAFFANSDGLYQVGEKICRISWYSYYEILTGNTGLIPELYKDANKINNEEIFVLTASEDSKRTQYYYRTDYFDDPSPKEHRMVSRHYKTWLPGPKYYYIRTTAQKKNWLGAWVREKIEYVKVSWPSGTVYSSGGQEYPVTGNTGTDRENVDIILVVTSEAVDFSTSYIYCTHKGKRGDVVKTRSTDFFN